MTSFFDFPSKVAANGIYRWMGAQPADHAHYLEKDLAFTKDQSVIGVEAPRDRIPSVSSFDEDETMDLAELLAALESKEICPLMNIRVDSGRLLRDEEAKQAHRDAQRPRPMLPVKTTYMLNSRRVHPNDQAALLRLKTLLHVARTNQISPATTRALIPVSHLSPAYAAQAQEVARLASACFRSALDYARVALRQITSAVDAVCGAGFFTGLGRRDRMAVLGAVFDQFPVFLLARFRARESAVVDFEAIFAAKGTGHRDRVARRRLATFYRYGWIRFCEKLVVDERSAGGGDGGDFEETRRAWLEIDKRGLVWELELGGVYDLPARRKMMFEKLRG
ncbi:uncharacterized protein L3040_004873 [Drepanopeziza brunnea f. sp. 'multigermtubi']|uniref:uncharacterized protein n=1 Tax=Drepanopeziza brunnea f. sp. 'multigermtubi' TaxID=698441 RepID=UPI0023979705|nr:hypothetical protein L3040_004873 [Drepanopeziza brunnea f. sp. 'multigermtubi']